MRLEVSYGLDKAREEGVRMSRVDFRNWIFIGFFLLSVLDRSFDVIFMAASLIITLALLCSNREGFGREMLH